jgi:hypothetical protein
VQIKIKITKKLVVQMALFIAIVGTAVLLDVYFENNPEELESIQAESKKQTNEQGEVYLISQTSSTSVKTSFPKNPNRKLRVESHDKFLRKHYHLRNYQVLKAEVKKQTTPLIHSYHYLVFQNYFFTLPDEEPLIA